MQHSPTAVLRPIYLIVPEPEPTSVRRREKKKALEIPSGVHALVLVQWVAGLGLLGPRTGMTTSFASPECKWPWPSVYVLWMYWSSAALAGDFGSVVGLHTQASL
uniref:Uncharacterized protein n=1 Tax=Bionectria ochroleuca TaxID=29856 RepID=A0A8H7N4M9_BIOOC